MWYYVITRLSEICDSAEPDYPELTVLLFTKIPYPNADNGRAQMSDKECQCI